MISEAILGAIVGGGAAVAGSVVQAWFNRQNTKDRIEADKQMQKSQHYVSVKVEALTELHSSLADCRQIIGRELANGSPDMTVEEFSEEIWPLIDSLSSAIHKSGIFLDSDQQEAVFDAYMIVTEANMSIREVARGQVTECSIDTKTLAEETNKAMDVIKNEVNGPIDEFESS